VCLGTCRVHLIFLAQNEFGIALAIFLKSGDVIYLLTVLFDYHNTEYKNRHDQWYTITDNCWRLLCACSMKKNPFRTESLVHKTCIYFHETGCNVSTLHLHRTRNRTENRPWIHFAVKTVLFRKNRAIDRGTSRHKYERCNRNVISLFRDVHGRFSRHDGLCSRDKPTAD